MLMELTFLASRQTSPCRLQSVGGVAFPMSVLLFSWLIGVNRLTDLIPDLVNFVEGISG